MAGRRVLVTGASGFIGRHLIPVLNERGFHITSLLRSAPPHTSNTNEAIIREIAPLTNWEGAFDNIDCIVHLGDGLNVFEKKERMRDQPGAKTQVDANAYFAQNAANAGVQSFLYVSSIKAMADESSSSILDESHAPMPTSLYGKSKLKIEQHLKQTAQSSNMRAITVRPPLVYGPRAPGNFAKLITLADTPWPLPLANLDNARSMIFVETLVDALATVLERTKVIKKNVPPNSTFLVHDGDPLSTTQLMKTMRTTFGRPIRLVPVPKFAWKALQTLPGVGPMALRLSGSLALSDTKFRKTFDWHPKLTPKQALQKAVQSLKSNAHA